MVLVISIPALAQRRFSDNNSSLSGTIRTADNKPAADMYVQLIGQNGQVAGSAYTNMGGVFDIINVPEGTYELQAVIGLNQVTERVEVRGMSSVALRLPAPEVSAGGGRHSVSVAQMKVPGKARKLFGKAQSAMEKQKLDDAGRYVEEALKVHPDYAEALTLRGILKLDAGKTDDARIDFERAVECDSGYAMSYIALGASYNMLKRYDDALRVIERGAALSPRTWQAYFELAKAFMGKGNYEAALRQAAKAGTLAPEDYAPIHLVKAHAALGLKDYATAMAELQAYLDRAPAAPNSAHARQTLEKVRAFAATQR